MSIESALEAGRAAALRLMKDRATLYRNGITSTDDEGYEVIGKEKLWEGPCKVQTYEPYETVLESAGQKVVVQRYSIHAPLDILPVIQVGDVFEVAGHQRPFQVTGLLHKTHQTAARILVDEVVA